MTRLAIAPQVGPAETADVRRIVRNVGWSRYEDELALRGDAAGPRLAFLEGALELMSPSREHERLKSNLGCLIEAYALERGVDLSPYGSWTLRDSSQASGIEPDECYLVGDQDKDVPDLAIEILWTRGGIDKLEIYRRLGVGEVWRWIDGRISVHLLRDGRYEVVSRSALFPDLDLAFVCSLLARPTALQAVRELLAALRA